MKAILDAIGKDPDVELANTPFEHPAETGVTQVRIRRLATGGLTDLRFRFVKEVDGQRLYQEDGQVIHSLPAEGLA